MIKYLIFCGGGSGGHVMPALTLIGELQKKYPTCRIHYIGSYKGIESQLVPARGISYRAIHTGKIRRYFSVENAVDMFRVLMGLIQSFIYLCRFSRKHTVVFSTGGFVSVPVVIAAWLTGKKVFVHEQTARIGLANKIASYFADTIFISFEQTRRFLPEEKVVYSGYPVRRDFYTADHRPVVIDGIDLSMLDRPLLFVTGGGNGSALINLFVKKNLDYLSQKFFVLHQVGKQDFAEYSCFRSSYYLPLAFLGDEMIDCMKLAKIIISRSGAGTVCELLALGKKSIFVPLKIAQKNEQYFNAMEASDKLGSIIISEDELAEVDLDHLFQQDFSVVEDGRLASCAQDVILSHLQSKMGFQN